MRQKMRHTITTFSLLNAHSVRTNFYAAWPLDFVHRSNKSFSNIRKKYAILLFMSIIPNAPHNHDVQMHQTTYMWLPESNHRM